MSGIRKKIVFLPYDFDTALGIDNYGRLRFDYHLEDIDTVNGEKVYAGQDSVLWKNVRAAFSDELASMWRTLRSGNDPALSYEKIEAMFEEHQSKWPEALVNEDEWYKYILPLIENNENRLEMCLGLKTEQRKWWLYNRFKYIDSKYNAGDASADSVSMRTYYEPAEGETYGITVTPYADIYATVMYGVSKSSVRAPRNQAILVPCALSHLEFTDTYIYSASQIKSFGDLSIFRPDAVEFSKATHIQELKLGDSDSNYSNPNLKALSLGNNVLLKKIDCRNCVNMGTGSQKTVDLSGCSNIEEVYFDGTAIGSITLPNGGFLKKLHLPSTITNLTVLNQKNITEFICPGFTNVTTLRIENCGSAINTKSIVQAIPEATRLRLVGFAWECTDAEEIEDLLDIFDSMRGLDEQGNTISIADGGCRTSISGTIHTDSLTGAQIAAYKARYPYLNVTADHTSAQLKFYNGTTLLATQTVLDGGDGTYSGSTPTKAADAQYTYTFAGWSKDTDDNTVDADALTHVTGDRNVYACYSHTIRTYTVTWMNKGTVVETDNNVPYGSLPHFDGTMPSYDGQTASGWDRDLTQPITGNTTINAVYVPMYNITFVRASEDGGGTLATAKVAEGTIPTYSGTTPTTTRGDTTEFTFTGWSPALAPAYANATYTAAFMDNRSPVITYLAGTIQAYESDSNNKIGDYAFYNRSKLETVEVPATSVGAYAFNGLKNLNVVDLTATSGAVSINSYAFSDCSKLEHLIIRSSTKATLSSTNALNNTPISSKKGAVYVPSTLVDAYKADSNWKNYRIEPLSVYPLTDWSTITVDLATFVSECKSGAAAEKYTVGDTKYLGTIFGTPVYAQIAGFEKDEKSDGSGAAKVSLAFEDILENQQMNTQNVATGGYPAMPLKTRVEGAIWDALPEVIRNNAVEVTKTYRLPDGTTSSFNAKLYPLSCREVFGTTDSYSENSGCIYSELFSSNNKRIKKFNGSASGWWLRSAYSSTDFRYVVSNGSSNGNSASDSDGVVLGFCL